MPPRLKLLAWSMLSTLGSVVLQAADIPEIVRNTKPAVVQLIVTDANGNVKTGSGFFISSNGLAVTNYHVVEGYDKIVARTPTGAFYAFGGLCQKVGDLDIALVGFSATDVPFLSILDRPKVVEGQRVLVIGNPEGLQGTVSDGIVSAIRDNGLYIQITAPVSPGSSGSPVLNEQGQVIGVATFIWKEGQNLNFAMSIQPIEIEITDLVTKSLHKSTPVPSVQRWTPTTDDLAAIERELNQTYTRLRSILNASSRETLKQDELEWLAARDKVRADPAAFYRATLERVSRLNKVYNEHRPK